MLVSIEEILDQGLPRIYTPADYNERCTAIFQHVYDRYAGSGQSIYAGA